MWNETCFFTVRPGQESPAGHPCTPVGRVQWTPTGEDGIDVACPDCLSHSAHVLSQHRHHIGSSMQVLCPSCEQRHTITRTKESLWPLQLQPWIGVLSNSSGSSSYLPQPLASFMGSHVLVAAASPPHCLSMKLLFCKDSDHGFTAHSGIQMILC